MKTADSRRDWIRPVALEGISIGRRTGGSCPIRCAYGLRDTRPDTQDKAGGGAARWAGWHGRASRGKHCPPIVLQIPFCQGFRAIVCSGL